MAWGGFCLTIRYHMAHMDCMVVMEVTDTFVWIKAMLSSSPAFPSLSPALPVPYAVIQSFLMVSEVGMLPAYITDPLPFSLPFASVPGSGQ